MDDSCHNAGPISLQQPKNGDAESIESMSPDSETVNPDAELKRQNELVSALQRQEFRVADEILETDRSLVYRILCWVPRENLLHHALRRGFRAGAIKYLSDQPDFEKSLDQPNDDGFLPLHLALREELDDDILDILIGKATQSSLVAKTKTGNTVLHCASRTLRPKIVEKLCSSRARDEIDSMNENGLTAVHLGIESWDVVSCLLRHGAKRDIDGNGNTLLHRTVFERSIKSSEASETRRQLLARGANLGAQNNEEETPFHVLVSHFKSIRDDSLVESSFQALQEVLGLGAEAPCHEQTKTPLVDALEKHDKSDRNLLHLMASYGWEHFGDYGKSLARQAVKDILSVWRDGPISRDGKGNTVYHQAIYSGNLIVVDELLEADQKLGSEGRQAGSLKNDAGDTPLHLASREDITSWQVEAVKKLMDVEQSIETILTRNNSEETPLHLAAEQSEAEVLKIFLAKWSYEIIADFDNGRKLQNNNGMTPLHIAAQGGESSEYESFTALEEILKGCTGPNLLDEVSREEGWTALHFAASRGRDKIVELLLLNGADSRKADMNNLFAADVARRESHIDVADFIRQYRPRSFRLGLEPGNQDTVKVDDHFLALSWPRWDKYVRQQHGESPRMWPHMTPVHQFIFGALDTSWDLRATPTGMSAMKDSLKKRLNIELSYESLDILVYRKLIHLIGLAPIHQAQIRLSSCDNKGWIMLGGRGLYNRRQLQQSHGSMKGSNLHGENDKPDSQACLYDTTIFQGEKRSTRWVHFPANNVCTTIITDRLTATSVC